MHDIQLPQFASERGALMRPKLEIDPTRTAVIAIDFQRFFIDDGQPMGNPHARDVLNNANQLHAAVRAAGGLVVFTQHSMGTPGEPLTDAPAVAELTLLPGSPAYDLHPDIERTNDDLTIVKYQSSPLHPEAATDLPDLLRRRGIETIIISGLVTNGCCDCTARDAFQHGYRVVFASDATAAMTDIEHNAALLNLEIYYAHVLQCDAIARVLG